MLVIISAPAFIGYPVVLFDSELLSGLTYGWVVYFFLVHAIILAINGTRFYANILAVAALISMPVVFVGGFISYIIFLLGFGYTSGQSAYSPHYVSVCVTMLTVIPLALSLVGLVPFQRFEHQLLQQRAGVSKLEKCILMFLRVFNHIVYFVIPNILETIREERHYRKWMIVERMRSSKPLGRNEIRGIKYKILTLITDMIQLAVEGICASIQYIPLWAVEISRLSDKKRKTSTG
ncbi:MAG: hypothetical protein JSV83_10005 [Desulfobacterales bacterium]|nr:MAG: hypothetical protein JSV83_10005 [Desulfobacterales bacterium]